MRRIPRERIVWLGVEALRRLATVLLTEPRRFLLSERVKAYLPIDAGEREKLERVLQTEAYAEVQIMNPTAAPAAPQLGRAG